MEELLASVVSLMILIPIIYFLPIGFTNKGKGLLVLLAFIFANIGILAKSNFPLWQSALLLLLLITLTVYIVDKRFDQLLYSSIHNHEKKNIEVQRFQETVMDERVKISDDSALKEEQVHTNEKLTDKDNEDSAMLERNQDQIDQTETTLEKEIIVEGNSASEEIEDISFLSDRENVLDEGMSNDQISFHQEEISDQDSIGYMSEIEQLLQEDEFEDLKDENSFSQITDIEVNDVSDFEIEENMQNKTVQDGFDHEQIILDDEEVISEIELLTYPEGISDRAEDSSDSVDLNEIDLLAEIETLASNTERDHSKEVTDVLQIDDSTVNEYRHLDESAENDENVLENDIQGELVEWDEIIPLAFNEVATSQSNEEDEDKEEIDHEEISLLENHLVMNHSPNVLEDMKGITNLDDSADEYEIVKEEVEDIHAEATNSLEQYNLEEDNFIDHVELEEIDHHELEEKTALQQQIFHTMVSQIHLARKRMKQDDYEKLVKNHLHPDLSAKDYYSFASLLVEHYISYKKFEKLQALLLELKEKANEFPILEMEIQYLYEHYCENAREMS